MVTIVDYIGHCDSNGNPMGHPVKVTNEFVELLKNNTEIGVAVPRFHATGINIDRAAITVLPNNVYIYSEKKVVNLQKKIQNIKLLKKINTDILWFVNIDFSLFLYLYLFGKLSNKKIWITLCYNPVSKNNSWRNKIIVAVLKNIDLIIVTNQNFLSLSTNTLFIPDYYFKENLYLKYLDVKKENEILCVGTMGVTKKLEEFIETFIGTDFNIKIIGDFSQAKARFEKLKNMASNNITIINKFVTDDEYYSLIAKSQYVILPYDMELYDERTSGILIESIFLKAIPIAPKALLDYNSINGVGYNDLAEVPSLLAYNADNERILHLNEKLVKTIFSYKKIKLDLLSRL